MFIIIDLSPPSFNLGLNNFLDQYKLFLNFIDNFKKKNIIGKNVDFISYKNC